MCSVKELFSSPKPIKRNFIQENVRQLRELERYWQNKEGKDIPSQTRVPAKIKFPNCTQRINVPSHITFENRAEKEKQLGLFKSIRNAKSAQPQKTTYPARKNSPTKQIITSDQNNTKFPRRAQTGKQRIDAELLRTEDIEKYIETQHANVFDQQKCGKRLSGSDLSLDLSSLDSLNLIKSPGTVTHRTTGCQTIHPDEFDNLYNEGTIRFPSLHKQLSPKQKQTNKKTNIHTISNQSKKENVATSPGADAIPSSDDDNVSPKLNTESPRGELGTEAFDKSKELSRDAIDFVRLNAKAVASVAKPLASVTNPMAAPPTYRKGVVPKYLQKRQEEWQKENEQKLLEAPDPACPPGHLPLSDAERKETLKMLKKSYCDLVHELNMMPVRTDTLRTRQKKMELEKQLNKLEEGIKVFSRPKVFVKIGE